MCYSHAVDVTKDIQWEKKTAHVEQRFAYIITHLGRLKIVMSVVLCTKYTQRDRHKFCILYFSG